MKTMLTFKDLRPLTSGLPKMAVLSDVPLGPVERICDGLIACGLDVTLLCLDKRKHFYAEHNKNLEGHTVEVRDNGKPLFTKYLALRKIQLSKFKLKPPYFEDSLFDVNLGISLQDQPHFAKAGLVLVCNAPGLIDWTAADKAFSNKAVAWRLNNCSGFTGFCSSTGGCEKWMRDGCRQCPQLGISENGKDFAYEMFHRKKKNFAALNMAIVTPSAWLGHCVRKSILLGHVTQTNISTCVNLDIYAPQSRSDARSFFRIPQDKKVILCSSDASRKNKGFHILCEALKLLQGKWEKNTPVLCFFGSKEVSEALLPKGYKSINLGYLDKVENLAKAYSAADFFVAPSFQDNLPNTVNEALACGTPVVCFDRFCSEDVVSDGITGYMAKHPGLPLSADGTFLQYPVYSASADSVADLAAKIHLALTMKPQEYAHMRTLCRKRAIEVFSPVLQAARYLQLYRRLLGLPEKLIEALPNKVVA